MQHYPVLGFAVRQRVVQCHLILFGGQPNALRKLNSVDDLIRVGEAGYASMVRIGGGRS